VLEGVGLEDVVAEGSALGSADSLAEGPACGTEFGFSTDQAGDSATAAVGS
jgi:hypothetical protein